MLPRGYHNLSSVRWHSHTTEFFNLGYPELLKKYGVEKTAGDGTEFEKALALVDEKGIPLSVLEIRNHIANQEFCTPVASDDNIMLISKEAIEASPTRNFQ